MVGATLSLAYREGLAETLADTESLIIADTVLTPPVLDVVIDSVRVGCVDADALPDTSKMDAVGIADAEPVTE